MTTVEAANALWRWRQAGAESQFSPQVLLVSEMPLEGVAYHIGGSSLPSNFPGNPLKTHPDECRSVGYTSSQADDKDQPSQVHY